MSNDKSLLLRVFIVYVRPILEYCSVVWSPCAMKDIDCIEKVQRQFTKRLPGLKSMSYTDRLKCLDLTTLELRRLHLDLIFCYKIVLGMVAINFSDIFEFSYVSKTREHAYKLFKSHSNNSTRYSVEDIHSVGTINNVETSYFTQLKMLPNDNVSMYVELHRLYWVQNFSGFG